MKPQPHARHSFRCITPILPGVNAAVYKSRATRKPTRVSVLLSLLEIRKAERDMAGVLDQEAPRTTCRPQPGLTQALPSVGACTKLSCQQSSTHSITLPPMSYRPNGLALRLPTGAGRSEEHTSELQSRGHIVCRLLLE